MLVFKKSDVETLIKKLSPNDKVTLAGDHGVYLMSFAEKTLKENEKRTVAYAVGCNPDMDEDWYDTKGIKYGGDDGADDLCAAWEISHLLRSRKELLVVITENTVEVTSR
jgi:hypothetical protein